MDCASVYRLEDKMENKEFPNDIVGSQRIRLAISLCKAFWALSSFEDKADWSNGAQVTTEFATKVAGLANSICCLRIFSRNLTYP